MTRAEALKEGKALLKRVKGRGWKLHVWENMGWHYAVRAPHVAVYVAGSGKYFAMVSRDKFCTSTPVEWYTDYRSSDPNLAVMVAVCKAQQVASNTLNVVARALRAVGV